MYRLIAGIRRLTGIYQKVPAPVSIPGPSPLVFLGDSLFYGWTDLCSHFAPALNRSTPGCRVSALDPPNEPARGTVILAGVNDLKAGIDPLTELVDLARRSPNARVCLLPPCEWGWDTSSPPADIGAFNRRLRTVLRDTVDMHTPMLKNGRQNARLFQADGIHPNRKGYAVMLDTLRQHL